jgi:hypothetical protein
MSKKVKLAIIDKDLKARTVKKYPVSDSGEQIKVKSGGEGHFMPSFDNDSYIEFPKRAFPAVWRITWDRVYFARKGSKECFNFKTGKVQGPDPELVKLAAGSTMLKDLGTEKHEMTWHTWAQLGISILILLKILGVM